MNKMILTILISLFAVGCTVQQNPTYTGLSTPNPQATMAAADNMALYAVNEATSQAANFQRQFAQATSEAMQATAAAGNVATGTAQAIQQAQNATSESIAIRVTEQAIAINSTYAAISANATGTAVSQVANAEQQLIADEQTRLALQREAEAEAIRYQRTMNTVKPVLWGAVGLAVLAMGFTLAYRIYMRTQPVMVNDSSGPRVLIPSNSYQVLPQPARQLALPEPEPQADSSPVLLPRLTYGHCLIVGVTGDGKSMALREIVDQRENVVVLDPHHMPGAWGAAKVIDRFSDIQDFMRWMLQELDRRIEQRRHNQQDFEPLTIACEEMPVIASEVDKGVYRATWGRWAREGRKFGLYLAVVSQSTRVKTLGIEREGDLLEAFKWVLELRGAAMDHYPELVSGMDRPAVLRSGNSVRPVIIPYDPRKDPESGQFVPYFTGANSSNGNSITVSRTGPMFTAPQPKGLNTQWGMVTPEQVSKILQLKAAGWANSKIETEVFEQENPGGAAYHKVKAVLDSTKNNVLAS